MIRLNLEDTSQNYMKLIFKFLYHPPTFMYIFID